MTVRAALVAALSLGAAVFARDAGACSCRAPEPSLLSPRGTEDAPANVKVRVGIPAHGGQTAQLVLRVNGGTNVDTKPRKISGQNFDVVELTPDAALAADTRYEVAVIDPQRHPPNHVIGTFKTAKAPLTDTTAPRIDKLGAVRAEKSGPMGSSCSVPGPWIVASDLVATDPARPNAQLVYGVWLGDASGNVDPTKPPTRILQQYGTRLVIGQASSCQLEDFPIPTTPFAWLGIAAIDEAGNQSAMKKVRVDLRGARTP